MHDRIAELFPICRSITGNGVRQTLELLRKSIPITVREIPTGTQVFDWTIPKEWNIRDGWVKNSRGQKIVDFRRSNLHVVNYSIPTQQRMSLAELRPHLHSLPDRPNWTPYRTSYYNENWGFCMPDAELSQLPEDTYEVYIDSTLETGSLTYGELLVSGRRSDEVLLSCHVCHPSMCNDNLSGVSLVSTLAELIHNSTPELSYRFLFIPGTIGSIAWLAKNEVMAQKIRHGLVVACVGDAGSFNYKRSRRGNAAIDQAVIQALKHCGQEFEVSDFSPYGYDERQFCSPGFNLAVGCLSRTPHGRFPQYHTSADNLDFVTPQALSGSLAVYLDVLQILEHNVRLISLNPKCEPQLGRRGLYRAMGGLEKAEQMEMAMLWVLNLSDGEHSLLDIAERANLPFEIVLKSARTLQAHQLVTQSAP